MCGIAGFFGEGEIPAERVDACLKLMRRRGPDSAAHHRFKNAAGRNVHLLHSRLNIIDLDGRADQPFHAGRKWLTYNGELYNYVELKRDLLAQGRSFKTESDTEVLLHAIDSWGWGCLDRFEGMWAFALYDEADGSLTLCRDRFGEKPLYIYQDSTGIFFGSEPKFLMALAGKRFEVDFDHLYRYLVNGYKSLYKEKYSFFRGMTELRPATMLRVDADGKGRASSYWKPRFDPIPKMTYGEAVEGARERLIRSVELRLRADVPLAFCMSGGVDSNALISIAKNVFHYDVHGFTIVNDDARYDEQELVEASVRDLRIRHTSIPVDTRNFLPNLRTLVRQHDAPVYTITYYAQWLLMESIAQHGYRISISGTGADELFTGYYDHHLAYLYELRDEPALHASARQSWSEHIRPIVRNPLLGNPDAFVQNPGMREHIFFNADGFGAFLKKDWAEPFREHRYTDSLLRNRMLNEMFHEAVPVILHEDDLNAMYFSIENRSPYLDRQLFDFCFSIPSKHMIQNAFAKSVLRDAMRGVMPEQVRANRRKVGFNAPIYSFLDVHSPDVKAALLDSSPVFDHVRRDKIEALLGKGDLPNSESKFLFYFLTSKMFLEEFAA